MRYLLCGLLMVVSASAHGETQDSKVNRNVEAVIVDQQRHRGDGWCRDSRGAYVRNDQQRTPSGTPVPPDCPDK